MAAPKTGNQWDTFGAFAQDTNREKTSNFPNSFITTDATASPQTSPLTVSSTIINLAVPIAAVTLNILNNANALRVSELSNVAKYFLLPASSQIQLPCVRMTNIYLVRDSADVAVQFYFSIV